LFEKNVTVVVTFFPLLFSKIKIGNKKNKCRNLQFTKKKIMINNLLVEKSMMISHYEYMT